MNNWGDDPRKPSKLFGYDPSLAVSFDLPLRAATEGQFNLCRLWSSKSLYNPDDHRLENGTLPNGKTMYVDFQKCSDFTGSKIGKEVDGRRLNYKE